MNYQDEVGQHYARIRHDAEYRMREMIADIQEEMMPPLYQDPPEPQPAREVEEIEIIQPPTIRYWRPKYLPRNQKGVGLAIEVEEIRRKVLYLDKKLSDIEEKSLKQRADRANRKQYKYK